MLSQKAVAAFSIPTLTALALIVAPIVACGGDETTNGVDPNNPPTNPGEDGGGTPEDDGSVTTPDGSKTPDGGGGGDGGGVDSGPPPSAQGDPCRGQPIPDDQHYSPPGMCARLVATNTLLRQIAFAPNGDLFGQRSNGTIYLLRDDDGDGYYKNTEIHNWGTTGGNGNNVHIDAVGGFVYAGSATGVKRFAYDPTSLTGGVAQDVVINQPGGGNHPKHTTHVYDGFLYVHSGSSGNSSHESGNTTATYDTKRSLIKRFNLANFTVGTPFNWDNGEVVSVGIRNGNGFARNEITKKIYDVSHSIDNQTYNNTSLQGGGALYNDNPGEPLLEIGVGKQYGYPFCFTAQRVVYNNNLITPGTQLKNETFSGGTVHDDVWCAANSTKPTTFFQAHSAPMDITFFDNQPQGALPEKWRGGAFVSLHGSWNRTTPTGYKVVWQPFNADGTSTMPTSTNTTTTFPYEVVLGRGTVAGGAVDGSWSWANQGQGESMRPVGVAVGPIDGALYISTDENSGNVYRVGLVKK